MPIKINLYRADGLKTLEFKFSEPKITYANNLVSILAAGRTITISGTSFLGYDEDIPASGIAIDFSDFWKKYVSEKYSEGQKILIVFLEDGTPLMVFSGAAISLNREQDFCKFLIDNKLVCLYKLNFLIISKNA